VFLTPVGLDKLRDAFVIVVGCGGVGSHCATALARSGVSKLRLIDFDQVTLSSLNRHAVATLADVGIPKVQCLQRRLIAISPWVKFDARNQKFEEDVATELLSAWPENGQKPDFVVDAIDNIGTKVALLKYCHDNNLPVISSAGAGCKSDPTRILVGDIGTSTYDRLSKATRRRLKLLGITSGIPVVYSTEQSGEGKAELLPVSEEEVDKGAVSDLGVLPSFRVRILPVLGTLPAIFGYVVANHVILSITGTSRQVFFLHKSIELLSLIGPLEGYPLDYVQGKSREKMYESISGFLLGSEERLAKWTEGANPGVPSGLRLPVTSGDIAFLVEELWASRSAVTGLSTKLVLVRWKRPEGNTMIRIGEAPNEQRSSKISLGDLVCMTKEEAIRHEKEVLKGGANPATLYDPATLARVEGKLKEAREYEKYRVL
jgi:tRNA threonylcarbamoyladenosine dehydratase